MAKLNALQEQLLKAGLAKKSKAAEAAREQVKARRGEAPSSAAELQREAERAREAKVVRDRALAAAQKAEAQAKALRAQARQIILDKRVPGAGSLDYRFTAEGVIRSLPVDETQRRQLANGQLVIAQIDGGFVLLPCRAADKVRERAPEAIVLDHRAPGTASPAAASDAEDDAYYAQFTVPDDLIW